MTIIPLSHARPWKLKALLLCHALAALLLASLWFPPLQNLWATIDSWLFHTINQTLPNHPWWQTLWALASHKNADWIEDLCILGFFIFYIHRAPTGMQSKRVAQMLFCTLYCAAIIFFFNRLLLRECLHIPRLSPSLACPDAFLLSQAVPWIHFKDTSTTCFPGDHATTAILFAATYSYFAKKKGGLFASILAFFFCFPRLITGAHWLSDIAVGSGSIALLFLSWAFCTPLHRLCIDKLTHLFSASATPKKQKPYPLYQRKDDKC
jgi:membrane-associated phospholipid phosphatase